MGPVGDFLDEWFGSTLLTSKAAPNHKAPKTNAWKIVSWRKDFALTGYTSSSAKPSVDIYPVFVIRWTFGLIEVDMELQRSGDWPVGCEVGPLGRLGDGNFHEVHCQSLHNTRFCDNSTPRWWSVCAFLRDFSKIDLLQTARSFGFKKPRLPGNLGVPIPHRSVTWKVWSHRLVSQTMISWCFDLHGLMAWHFFPSYNLIALEWCMWIMCNFITSANEKADSQPASLPPNKNNSIFFRWSLERGKFLHKVFAECGAVLYLNLLSKVTTFRSMKATVVLFSGKISSTDFCSCTLSVAMCDVLRPEKKPMERNVMP